MTSHEAMMIEARRVGWPVIFKTDLALDALEFHGNPERYRAGFGWLLTGTSTHLVPPAPGAASIIEDLSIAYPRGRWYFVRDGALERIKPQRLCRRLDALRAPVAA